MSEKKNVTNRELSLEELDQVRGGYSKNNNGTFTLNDKDQIKGGGYLFIIKGNYPEATADSWINVEECVVNADGTVTSYGENSYTVRAIFDKTGQTVLMMM